MMPSDDDYGGQRSGFGVTALKWEPLARPYFLTPRSLLLSQHRIQFIMRPKCQWRMGEGATNMRQTMTKRHSQRKSANIIIRKYARTSIICTKHKLFKVHFMTRRAQQNVQTEERHTHNATHRTLALTLALAHLCVVYNMNMIKG